MAVKQLVDRTELTHKNTDTTIIKILKDLLTSFFYQVTKSLGNIGLIKKTCKNLLWTYVEIRKMELWRNEGGRISS